MNREIKGTFVKNLNEGTIEPLPPIKGTFEKNLNEGTIEPLPPIKGTFVSCKYEK